MANVTQMDIIKADIEYGAIGTTNKDITRNILNEWRGCQTIKDMQEVSLYLHYLVCVLSQNYLGICTFSVI